MPSAFTHIIAGAAATQVLPAGLPRWRIALTLGLAAALPDLDVIAFRLGIPYEHPLGHRGLSHSLVAALIVGGAAALAGSWGRVEKGQYRLALTLTGFMAVASHGVLDAATDAGRGVGFFVPFSKKRFFFPWRPIETSSVNPSRFFSQRGVDILISEIVFVWLPILVASFALLLWRRLKRASAAA